ncbi:MAG: M20/M25/M40 family metallo-hydrolase [Ignavibacteria bacterium]|nr:M20/M25/M40 family metallo-hydrolase [Ignavibacteria bacterium]
MPSSLVDLFLDAVRVEALPLRERPMAQFVRRSLAGLPVKVIEDDTGHRINGECGNIICVPEWFDSGRPAIALFAHMDTPRNTAFVHPVLTQTKITSDGTTILGVDNRAGSSILLQALRESLPGRMGNFLVVFTVAGEIGLYGSKHINLDPYNVRLGFVFDSAKRPGTFVQSAIGCSLYTATFIGKAAGGTAGPAEGVNAIKIAAKALSRVPVGRPGPGVTSNVGMIIGGEATNIVPERCVLRGEVRAFNTDRLYEHISMLKATFVNTANERNGSVEFETTVDFPPYAIDKPSESYRVTAAALQAVGLDPFPIDDDTGSDANMLNAHGIPTINLGIGAQNPNANDEFILLEDLHKAEEIAKELITMSASL